MEFINHLNTQKLQGIIACYDNDLFWQGIHENGKPKALQPLSQKNINLLAELTKKQATEATINYHIDFITPNILHFKKEQRHLIWYSKPQRQKLLFDEKLNIQSTNYPLPYLLWVLQENTLKVFALKNAPKDANEPLFQAPFLNVYNSGKVCMGSASLKHRSTDYSVLIPFCEYAFFNSTFTHTNCDRILTRNIVDVYTQQAQNPKLDFNNDLLLKTELTIKDLF